MNQWHLIIDVARCENCNNCVLAEKDEFVGNDFRGYSAPQALHGASTIRIERRVRGSGHLVDAAYLPVMCQHCDDAPCIKAGAGAVTKRPDGIVIIDPVKAKGRRDLVESCPYGAIVWNEEAQLPQAWIFDAHLLDSGWKEPRCAQSCPTDAIRAVLRSDAEMAEVIAQEKLEPLKPELGTKPHVHYKNLHRFASEFIGGSVTRGGGDQTDCVAGATVTLQKDGKTIRQTATDTFGDFKFDGLKAGSGRYAVRVEHAKFGIATVEAALGETVNLGEISLRSVARSS